jgi:hypothetical protein
MKMVRIAVAAAVLISSVGVTGTADAAGRRGWHGHHRHCTWVMRHHHRMRRCR